MSGEYKIKIHSDEDVENSVNQEVLELIEKNSDIEIDRPTGALGITGAATIVIAISASYQLVRDISKDINNHLNDGETAEIEDFESPAKLVVANVCDSEYNQLTVSSVSKNGRNYEIMINDNNNRTHRVRIDRFDIGLNEPDHTIE